MDKFPSTTTIWLILRKFEAGVAGSGGAKKNLTARGSPSTSQGNSGAGRLYYQSPVIQVMGRELSSFTDLQKSLAQLGLNSGTALLRLSFKATETPLEEAMDQIEGYFKTPEDLTTPSAPAPPSDTENQESTSKTNSEKPESSRPVPEWTEDASAFSTPAAALISTDGANPPDSDTSTATAAGRPVSVYAAPSSSMPSAAQSSYNPSDYMPTVEHAQSHQRMLSQSSRNVRLPTEAEIAQQAEAEQAKLSAIKDVEVKVRFPDESAVSTRFTQNDSGSALYAFVRSCLDTQWMEQNFELRIPGAAASPSTSTSGNLSRVKSSGSTAITSVPDVDSKRLITDLGLKGRVLLVFQWDPSATIEAQSSKEILKSELRAQAVKPEVKEVAANTADDNDRGVQVNLGGPSAQKSGDEEQGTKKKLPKWLKGLSKK